MIGNKVIGNIGEELAVNYLRGKGYRVLDRNYRSRCGELDIILLKDEVLVFVEVKTRRSDKYGAPREAVNYHKVNKIVNTANNYLIHKKMSSYNVRFDVIEICFDKIPRINHIKDAFRH